MAQDHWWKAKASLGVYKPRGPISFLGAQVLWLFEDFGAHHLENNFQASRLCTYIGPLTWIYFAYHAWAANRSQTAISDLYPYFSLSREMRNFYAPISFGYIKEPRIDIQRRGDRTSSGLRCFRAKRRIALYGVVE
ncbi:uncharacterized protein CIMG_13118 [Coccidioides immitis RS]|uniref:Uncharacterized protein n=1 Tax=Coccidioides immitis (strain RS) TaxID=246410 RepID=A0A0D8JTL6_COCIM|nr:uncharacterized protein CIMG_13118 [Coccidioides immitis RS]KJF60670.1 hypothetical protein CIMG_13118 [Coccidioides immitis RS]